MQTPSLDPARSGNRLLDALPAGALDRLRPHLEDVPLGTNQRVHEPGETIDHVLFPLRGMISMVATMNDGTSVEIGMVGNEGVYSVSAILGDDKPSHRAMVQLAGSALRMPSQILRQEAQGHADLQTLLLRYVQVTLSSVAQTAACNRLHPLEQRCARWLLSAHDRAQADTFRITHEFLSMMLGVRRPGVTIAAQNLQANGVITYSHGTMNILNRQELEAASCECYSAIADEFRRLLLAAE